MNRFFQLITAAAIRMPRRHLDFLVEAVALRLAFLLNPVRKRIILANYRRILSFGGKSPTERQLSELLKETLPLYGRLLISMLARPEDVEFARTRVDLEELLPAMEKARQGGKGVILAFSNFGLFTYTIMALLLRDIPLRIPILNHRNVAHLPYGWPASFITVGKSGRECLRMLAENKAVAVVTMLNYMTKRLTLDFFGAPARLGYAPARLAASSGAPILPVFTVLEGGCCQARADEPLEPEYGPEALEKMTSRLARCQEKYILRYPAQSLVYEDFWNMRSMDANYRYVRWLLRRS